jgi:YD repeat-containing protein
MDPELRDAIEATWATLEKAHETMRARAERDVAAVFWGSGSSDFERLEPLYSERARMPLGRRFRTRPASLSGMKEYLVDAEGRVVLARAYDVTAGREPGVPDDVVAEEYFVYRDTATESYRLHSAWVVEGRNFERRWMVRAGLASGYTFNEKGQLVERGQFFGPLVIEDGRAEGGWDFERYDYDPDGRLTRVELTGIQRAYDEDVPAGTVVSSVEELSYGEDSSWR